MEDSLTIKISNRLINHPLGVITHHGCPAGSFQTGFDQSSNNGQVITLYFTRD